MPHPTTLPFPNLSFPHWVWDDQEAYALLVKGTFGIQGNGLLGVMPDQEPILAGDVYFGDMQRSSLRFEQDIAPYKPKTDVILHAVARSPEGKALPDWPVSVEIKDKCFYGFQVRGPSQWHRHKNKWHLNKAEPVSEVPIRYELAYGGHYGENEFYPFNPIGKGFIGDFLNDHPGPIDAPQIGDLGEFISGDIHNPMMVHGFGPIAKTWLPRRSLAGTFDKTWESTRHPRMPNDYSFDYWNAAPKKLQISPYLRGGEQFILKGLRHDPEPYFFSLPNIGVAAQKNYPDGPQSMLKLSDVMIDVSNPNPDLHRVYLIWRGLFKYQDDLNDIHLVPAKLEN